MGMVAGHPGPYEHPGGGEGGILFIGNLEMTFVGHYEIKPPIYGNSIEKTNVYVPMPC